MSDPDQLAAVREEPAALTAAINEGVRWETPLQFSPRLVTRDALLAGVQIPAGSTVVAVIGAANHDPSGWEDPERFDLRRPYKSALAFGDPAHPQPTIEGTLMRSPARLNVVWDA